MLKQALEGDCVFAVGREIKGGDDDKPSIAPVGTACLIRASREREDGTSELLLHGVIRVKFTEWLDEEPYPCALIDPLNCDPLSPDQDQAAIRTLKGAVEDSLTNLPEDVRAGVMTLVEQADEAGLMADLIAQQLVHDADLRQRLLETPTVGKRVSLLCDFLHKMPNQQ